MLDYAKILELIDKLADSALTEISIDDGTCSLTLRKDAPALPASAYMAPPSPTQAPAPAPDIPSSSSGTPELSEVTAPMVGTFYAAPSPESPPYVQVGQNVNVGDVLCILEAMKVMNELTSEVSGTIQEILVNNGEPVEFGQVLFRVSPDR